jgi:ubiquinone/menaquinone biosynthesis C-methylase UbiE
MKEMISKIQNILRCPYTGRNLRFDESVQSFLTANGDRYPVVDGIVDFLRTDPKDCLSQKIRDAYDSLASDYDKFATSRTFATKIYNTIFRGFASDSFAYDVAQRLPEDFGGVLVDCPAGTGVFTSRKYSEIPKATIFVLEYSLNMLLEAKKKYQAQNIQNVVYILADMKNMPIAGNSVDVFLSMSGFHAIAGKDTALCEVDRVLKPGGKFSGCFYVRGKRKLTDLFVSCYHEPKGWFVPPFFSEQDVVEKFSQYFELKPLFFLKSFVVFEAYKATGGQMTSPGSTRVDPE